MTLVQPGLFDAPVEVLPEPAPEPRQQQAEPAKEFSIRPYQQLAVDNTVSCWEESRSSLVVMATGLGKSAVSGFLANRLTQTDDSNYLFLAHRKLLIKNGYETMRSINPHCEVSIEQGENYVDVRAGRNHIVVACTASLKQMSRLERFGKNFFRGITVDECHHATGQSYRDILDFFAPAKINGITATADRTDEVALGTVFETVAYEYGILDGINDAWLVPIVQQLDTVEGFDLSKIDETSSGDLNESQLAEEMRTKKMLHAISSAAVKYSNLENGRESRRPTLVFCASVEHAEDVANILNSWHAREGSGKAGTINSTKMSEDDVKDTISAFRRGTLQYLTNFGMLTEGVDIPGVKVIIMGRITKSRSLYSQMCGRGIRPLTEIVVALNAAKDVAERKAIIRASRKPGALIVDLVGNSGQHKLITTLDILGGKYPDEVVAKVKEKVLAGGGRTDADAMAKAMEEEEKQQVQKKKSNLILKAELSSRVIDPFDIMDVASTREPGWFKGKRPTERMEATLRKNGLSDKEIAATSFFKAKTLIDRIVLRAKTGLCSLRQLTALARRGINGDAYTYQQAREVLNGG